MPTQPRTTTSAVTAAPPGSGAPADARLKLVREAISRPDVKVVSTDIFDTLVWRQVAEMSEMLPAPARMRGVAEAGVRVKRLEHEFATLKNSLPPGAVKALERVKRLAGG